MRHQLRAWIALSLLLSLGGLVMPGNSLAMTYAFGAHPDKDRLVFQFPKHIPEYTLERVDKTTLELHLPEGYFSQDTPPAAVRLGRAKLLRAVRVSGSTLRITLRKPAFGYLHFTMPERDKLVVDVFRIPWAPGGPLNLRNPRWTTRRLPRTRSRRSRHLLLQRRGKRPQRSKSRRRTGQGRSLTRRHTPRWPPCRQRTPSREGLPVLSRALLHPHPRQERQRARPRPRAMPPRRPRTNVKRHQQSRNPRPPPRNPRPWLRTRCAPASPHQVARMPKQRLGKPRAVERSGAARASPSP
mgnify:CR=1 FL=1